MSWPDESPRAIHQAQHPGRQDVENAQAQSVKDNASRADLVSVHLAQAHELFKSLFGADSVQTLLEFKALENL